MDRQKQYHHVGRQSYVYQIYVYEHLNLVSSFQRPRGAETKGPLSPPWNSLILVMHHNREKIERVLRMKKRKKKKYRQMVIEVLYCHEGWIGTAEVNRDTGLEPGEIQTKCFSRLELDSDSLPLS